MNDTRQFIGTNTNNLIMREEIINNLDNPRQLEVLYRENKAAFRKAFNLVYPGIRDKTPARIWHERLNFEHDEISWGTTGELLFVIAASFLAGLAAKIPAFTAVSEEYFYPRNSSFVVFPFLTAYFAWKQKLHVNKWLVSAVIFLVSVIYMNLLPDEKRSDTVILACIHMPLFLWAVLGFTFTGEKPGDLRRRLDFLRYNGDLVVMTTIILISGALLTGVTLGLFELIDIKIEEFYFQYIAVWGAAAAPIVGTYLVRTNPQLVSKISPVIARIFSPLVLVMLVIYLAAVMYTGEDPYNDREFLLVFNLLLIGVMAIILFSIAETTKKSAGKAGTLLLAGLSLVTVIVNVIALSAILFRINEWGITPNRLAVLGGNILMLTNLLMVTFRMFRAIRNEDETEGVEKSIASFLPVYAIWTIAVTFIFPLLFSFK